MELTTDILTAVFLFTLLAPFVLNLAIFIYQTFVPPTPTPTVHRDPITGQITIFIGHHHPLDVTDQPINSFKEYKS